VIENLFLSSSLPLKYNLLIGPRNGVSRCTQKLVEKKLKTDELFFTFETKVSNVNIFLAVESSFTLHQRTFAFLVMMNEFKFTSTCPCAIRVEIGCYD